MRQRYSAGENQIKVGDKEISIFEIAQQSNIKYQSADQKTAAGKRPSVTAKSFPDQIIGNYGCGNKWQVSDVPPAIKKQ